MRSVIPNPNTMNTAVRSGGSAPPMTSLESSVDVWDWVLLRVLSATLVCEDTLEPDFSSLLIRGECMVMRLLRAGFAVAGEACAPVSPALSESAAGVGALSYTSMVMLSAEAESVDTRLSSLWVVVCSWCVDCVSCRIVDSDTVCLVVWQAQSSTAPRSINNRREDLRIVIALRIRW